MADEADDQSSDNDNSPLTTGQRSQDNEFGERGQQTGAAPQMEDQDGDAGPDGQIDQSKRSGIAGGSSAGAGLESRPRQGDGMSGQPIGGNDSATGTGTTLTQGADFGEHTTSNSGRSSVGTDQTSGGSSGISGGKGLIGSQAGGSDDNKRNKQDRSEKSTGSSTAAATGGKDFAREGRGALDNGDEPGFS